MKGEDYEAHKNTDQQKGVILKLHKGRMYCSSSCFTSRHISV